eukprot:TRINITY_DN5801_c0_g1_i1.p1 TRINITY_DN5801_c0_g1~~TRINITY_DN5801_c0_g1_i1.p1  ORF type:complete len:228 (-),score=46.94 TRINITY_DN5801_c0_g1_i1:4-687(-)
MSLTSTDPNSPPSSTSFDTETNPSPVSETQLTAKIHTHDNDEFSQHNNDTQETNNNSNKKQISPLNSLNSQPSPPLSDASPENASASREASDLASNSTSVPGTITSASPLSRKPPQETENQKQQKQNQSLPSHPRARNKKTRQKPNFLPQGYISSPQYAPHHYHSPASSPASSPSPLHPSSSPIPSTSPHHHHHYPLHYIQDPQFHPPPLPHYNLSLIHISEPTRPY